MHITREQKKKLQKCADHFHLQLLYLFGSTARGDQTKTSDVDIAYLSDKRLTLSERSDLSDAIQHALQLKGHEIDLVDLMHAPPLLSYLIFQEGQKILGDRQTDDRFYRTTMKRYIDAKPIFNATALYVHETLAV
jgi:predicted nucleotidyltransferase